MESGSGDLVGSLGWARHMKTGPWPDAGRGQTEMYRWFGSRSVKARFAGMVDCQYCPLS